MTFSDKDGEGLPTIMEPYEIEVNGRKTGKNQREKQYRIIRYIKQNNKNKKTSSTIVNCLEGGTPKCGGRGEVVGN